MHSTRKGQDGLCGLVQTTPSQRPGGSEGESGPPLLPPQPPLKPKRLPTRPCPVRLLAAVLKRLGHDARGEVRDADGGVRLVAVLAPWTTGRGEPTGVAGSGLMTHAPGPSLALSFWWDFSGWEL